MTSPVDMNSRMFMTSPASKRGRHTVMSYVPTKRRCQSQHGLNDSFTSSQSSHARVTPSPHLFNGGTTGRHSVPLSTPPPVAAAIPALAFIREGTNVSQLSHHSEASNPGPLTKERTLLRHELRTKTRGGTRYLMKYNDHHVRVKREDGFRIGPRRTRSRESIVSSSRRCGTCYDM